MKIIFLCNKYVEKYKMLIEEISNIMILDKKIETKIKIANIVNLKSKYDMYIILSDDSEEIEEISHRILSKNSILIMTENLASSHILKCIEITPNICYAVNSTDVLVKKICACYMIKDDGTDEKV